MTPSLLFSQQSCVLLSATKAFTLSSAAAVANPTHRLSEAVLGKSCKTCQRVLPLDEFYCKNVKNGKAYYDSSCTTCTKKASNRNYRKRVEANPKLTRMKLLLNSAAARAKEQGLEFSLSLEWLASRNLETCPILKKSFAWKADVTDPSKYGGKNKKINPMAPSIDRLDSTKGYTPENCWVISRRMNAIKNDSHYRELYLLARAVCDEMMRRTIAEIENCSQ